MSITKNVARAEVKCGYVDINLADVATGVAADAIDMPANSVLLGGFTKTTEAWNSTSTDVLSVGDAGSGARYLSSGNIRALDASVALVPTGYIYTTPTAVSVTWTSGGGTPTTGKVRVYSYYMIVGRATSTQG
jgi:hypothetical protein